jgi:anti-anti-sigma factor
MARAAEASDDSVRRGDQWGAPEFCIEASMSELGTLSMSVKGELELSTADGLLDELGEWLGIRECIIDLSGCDFVDSVGIRALVECRHQIGPESSLRLIGLTPRLARILQRTGLDRIATLEPGPPEAPAEQQHY